MYIYSCKNKNNRGILVVASNEKEAIEICLDLKHAKSQSNIFLDDITSKYIEAHEKNGFKLPDKKGQLVQHINGRMSEWTIHI